MAPCDRKLVEGNITRWFAEHASDNGDDALQIFEESVRQDLASRLHSRLGPPLFPIPFLLVCSYIGNMVFLQVDVVVQSPDFHVRLFNGLEALSEPAIAYDSFIFGVIVYMALTKLRFPAWSIN